MKHTRGENESVTRTGVRFWLKARGATFALLAAGLLTACAPAAPAAAPAKPTQATAPTPTAAAVVKPTTAPDGAATGAPVPAATTAPAAAAKPASTWEPTKAVQVVVHSDPGSGSDKYVRAMAQMFEQEGILKQPLQVVNRSGGSSAVAQAYLGEQRGNDHLLAMWSSTWVATAIQNTDLKVTIKDLTPVVRLALEPSVAVVNASAPYKTLKDFLDAAKAKPNTLRQAGGSVTSVDNQYRFLLMGETGAKWDFISFPGGGERIAALLGNQVDLYIGQTSEVSEHVRAGRLRPVAALVDKRLAEFPDAPTLKEQGIDITLLYQARGVAAPAGIPQATIDFWTDAFERLSKTERYKTFMKNEGLEEAFMAGAPLRPWFDEQFELTRKVMLDGGMIKR